MSQGNLLQDLEHKFEQLPEDQKISKLCCNAGLKIVETGQLFITLDEEEGPDEMKNVMSSLHFTSKLGNIPCERVDSRKHEDRPSPGCEGLLSSRTLRC